MSFYICTVAYNFCDFLILFIYMNMESSFFGRNIVCVYSIMICLVLKNLD